MATEYKDSTFGETLPIDDAMKEFVNAMEEGKAKAFHVGSYDEIEKERAALTCQRDIQKSMDELTKRLDNLEKDESIIKPATAEQISKITGND